MRVGPSDTLPKTSNNQSLMLSHITVPSGMIPFFGMMTMPSRMK
jgi:hypothetical protein